MALLGQLKNRTFSNRRLARIDRQLLYRIDISEKKLGAPCWTSFEPLSSIVLKIELAVNLPFLII